MRQWIQERLKRIAYYIPREFWYGPGCSRQYLRLKRMMHEDPGVIHRWQRKRFNTLARRLSRRSDYWRKIFHKWNHAASSMEWREQFESLPLLDKRDLQSCLEEISVDAGSPGTRYMTTGGSTGIPTGFYLRTIADQQKEWAHICYLWSQVGFRFGGLNRRVSLRGEILPGNALALRKGHELLCSSFHLSKENLPRLMQVIRSFRPRFLHTFPSAALRLAELLAGAGEGPPRGLRAILASSESLPDKLRYELERFYRVPVYAHYGHSERAVLAGGCRHSPSYHILPTYGLVELLDERGRVIREAGRSGEIVATSLTADRTPFIRFRTGDFGEYDEGPCPCGSPVPRLKAVHGRQQEYLEREDGVQVSASLLNLHLDILDQVTQVQFIQERPGAAVLSVVPRPGTGRLDRKAILRAYEERLGKGFLLELQVRDQLLRTRSDKTLLVVRREPQE